MEFILNTTKLGYNHILFIKYYLETVRCVPIHID